MIEDEFVVVNCASCESCAMGDTAFESNGLHAKPSARIIQLTNEYKECEIYIMAKGIEVNAKTIMGLLMLAAPTGTRLRIRCNGASEKDARDRIADVLVRITEEEDICPDFDQFRAEYACSFHSAPSDFRKISNAELLRSYAQSLRAGRLCSGIRKRLPAQE